MQGIDWSKIGRSDDESTTASEPKAEQESSLFENVRIMNNLGKQSLGTEYPTHSAPVYSSRSTPERISQSRRGPRSYQQQNQYQNTDYKQTQYQNTDYKKTQYTSGQSYFDTMPDLAPPPAPPDFMDIPGFGGRNNYSGAGTTSDYENPHRVSSQSNRRQTNYQQTNGRQSYHQSADTSTQRNSRSGYTQNRSAAPERGKSGKAAVSSGNKKSQKRDTVEKPRKTAENSGNKRTAKKYAESPKGTFASPQNAGNVNENRKGYRNRSTKTDRLNKKYSINNGKGTPDSNRRRFQKDNSIKKKLILISVIVLLILVIGSVSTYFIGTNYLVVSKINVVNAESTVYSEAEITEATDITVGDSMLFIGLSSVEEKITTKLPYIGTATVKKDWPDVLTVEVKETTDKYAVVLNNEEVWLNSEGKVLSNVKKSVSKGRIKVIGFYPEQEYEIGSTFTPSDENKEYYDVLSKISAGIDASGLKIKSIEFLGNKSVCLTYNKYIKIYGNYDNDYDTKLAGVKDLIKSIGKINSDFYFDIRSKNKIYYNYGTIS